MNIYDMKQENYTDYIIRLQNEHKCQRDRIQELEKKNAELSDTINRMHGGCERAIELRRLLDELFGIKRDQVVSDDEIREMMKGLRDKCTGLTNENIELHDRCTQLEDKDKLQRSHIEELRTELDQLRVAAKDAAKRIENLSTYLSIANKTAQDYYDEREIFRKVKDEYECRYNSLVKISDNCAKDADAKIQSANDRAANAKKEAKAAKERAESAFERVRYLERKLRDVEGLNDSLMKELTSRQVALLQVVDKDADAYQQNVLKYAPDHHDYLLNVIYAAMGMCGEAGEASELIKKYAYHGHTIDTEHLARELGDVLWYVSYMAHLFGYPLGKIMAMNQEKLAKRYPDGKFDAERSRNREEGDI